ncbi:hypothetical protein HY990_03690 [Candidatus Micrarchaeota archaeon]|nr:hypothetical protein [Candidatus Micrarchaeota archaeon]
MVGPNFRTPEQLADQQAAQATDHLRESLAPLVGAPTTRQPTASSPLSDAAARADAARESVRDLGRQLAGTLPPTPSYVERLVRSMLDATAEREFNPEISALTGLAQTYARSPTPAARDALRAGVENFGSLVETVQHMREAGFDQAEIAGVRAAFVRSLNPSTPNAELLTSTLSYVGLLLTNHDVLSLDQAALPEYGSVFRHFSNTSVTNEFLLTNLRASNSSLLEYLTLARSNTAERVERLIGHCDDLMERNLDPALSRQLEAARERLEAIQNSLSSGRLPNRAGLETLSSIGGALESATEILSQSPRRDVISLCTRSIEFSLAGQSELAQFISLSARAISLGHLPADRNFIAALLGPNPDIHSLTQTLLAAVQVPSDAVLSEQFRQTRAALLRLDPTSQNIQRIFGFVEIAHEVASDRSGIPRNFGAESLSGYNRIIANLFAHIGAGSPFEQISSLFGASRAYLHGDQQSRSVILAAASEQNLNMSRLSTVTALSESRYRLEVLCRNRRACGELYPAYQRLLGRLNDALSILNRGETIADSELQRLRLATALLFGSSAQIRHIAISGPDQSAPVIASYSSQLENARESLSHAPPANRADAARYYAAALDSIFTSDLPHAVSALLFAQAYSTNSPDRLEIGRNINNPNTYSNVTESLNAAQIYLSRGAPLAAITDPAARAMFGRFTRLSLLEVQNGQGANIGVLGAMADSVTLAAASHDPTIAAQYEHGFTTSSGIQIPPLAELERRMRSGESFGAIILSLNPSLSYEGQRSSSMVRNENGEPHVYSEALSAQIQLCEILEADLSALEMRLEHARAELRTQSMALGATSRAYARESARLRRFSSGASNPSHMLLYSREAALIDPVRASERMTHAQGALDLAGARFAEAALYQRAAITLSGPEYAAAIETARRETGHDDQAFAIEILRRHARDLTAQANMLHQASLGLSNATFMLHRDVVTSAGSVPSTAGRFALVRAADNFEQTISEVGSRTEPMSSGFVQLNQDRLRDAGHDFSSGYAQVTRIIAIRNMAARLVRTATSADGSVTELVASVTDSSGRVMHDREVVLHGDGGYHLAPTTTAIVDGQALHNDLERARVEARSGHLAAAQRLIMRVAGRVRERSIRVGLFGAHDVLLAQASPEEREAGSMAEFDTAFLLGQAGRALRQIEAGHVQAGNLLFDDLSTNIIPTYQGRQTLYNMETANQRTADALRAAARQYAGVYYDVDAHGHRTLSPNGAQVRRDANLDQVAATATADANAAEQRAHALAAARENLNSASDMVPIEITRSIVTELGDAGPTRGLGGVDRQYAVHMHALADALQTGGDTAVMDYLLHHPDLLRRGTGLLRARGDLSETAERFLLVQADHVDGLRRLSVTETARDVALHMASEESTVLAAADRLYAAGRLDPQGATVMRDRAHQFGLLGGSAIADPTHVAASIEDGTLPSQFRQLRADQLNQRYSLLGLPARLTLTDVHTAAVFADLGFAAIPNTDPTARVHYRPVSYTVDQRRHIDRILSISEQVDDDFTNTVATLTPGFSATNLTFRGSVSARQAQSSFDSLTRSFGFLGTAFATITQSPGGVLSPGQLMTIETNVDNARTQRYDSAEFVERGVRRERVYSNVAMAGRILGAGFASATGFGVLVAPFFLGESTFGYFDQARAVGGAENLTTLQRVLGLGGIALAGIGVVSHGLGGLATELGGELAPSGTALVGEATLLNLQRVNTGLAYFMGLGGVAIGVGSVYETWHSDPGAGLFEYGLIFFNAAQPGLMRGFQLVGEANSSLVFGTSFRARAYRFAMAGFFGVNRYQAAQMYNARLSERVRTLSQSLDAQTRENFNRAMALSGVPDSLELRHDVLRMISGEGSALARDPVALSHAIAAYEAHADAILGALPASSQAALRSVEATLGRYLSAGERLFLAHHISESETLPNTQALIGTLEGYSSVTPELTDFVSAARENFARTRERLFSGSNSSDPVFANMPPAERENLRSAVALATSLHEQRGSSTAVVTREQAQRAAGLAGLPADVGTLALLLLSNPEFVSGLNGTSPTTARVAPQTRVLGTARQVPVAIRPLEAPVTTSPTLTPAMAVVALAIHEVYAPVMRANSRTSELAAVAYANDFTTIPISDTQTAQVVRAAALASSSGPVTEQVAFRNLRVMDPAANSNPLGTLNTARVVAELSNRPEFQRATDPVRLRLTHEALVRAGVLPAPVAATPAPLRPVAPGVTSTTSVPRADPLARLRRAEQRRRHEFTVPSEIRSVEDLAALARAAVRREGSVDPLLATLSSSGQEAVRLLTSNEAFRAAARGTPAQFQAYMRGFGIGTASEPGLVSTAYARFSEQPAPRMPQMPRPETEYAERAVNMAHALLDPHAAEGLATLSDQYLRAPNGSIKQGRDLIRSINSPQFEARAIELLGQETGRLVVDSLRSFSGNPVLARSLAVGLAERNPLQQQRFFHDWVTAFNESGRVRTNPTTTTESERRAQHYSPNAAESLRNGYVDRGIPAVAPQLTALGFDVPALTEALRTSGFAGLNTSLADTTTALNHTLDQAGATASVDQMRAQMSFAAEGHGPINPEMQRMLLRQYAEGGADAIATALIHEPGARRDALKNQLRDAFLSGGNLDALDALLTSHGATPEQFQQLRASFVSSGTAAMKHSVNNIARLNVPQRIEFEGICGFLASRGITYREPTSLTMAQALEGARAFADLVALGGLEHNIHTIPGFERASITGVSYRAGLSGAYAVTLEIPGENGAPSTTRRIFVKTEDLQAAALGEELARTQGILTARHYHGYTFENGRTYQSGNPEQVNYGIMQDIHDLVGTWQNVRMPDGTIREMYIDGLALMSDEIIDEPSVALNDPRSAPAVRAFYDEMRTEEGRSEFFRSLYDYHNAASEIALGDRRSANSGYAVGRLRDGTVVRTAAVAIDMDGVAMRIEPVMQNGQQVRDANGNPVHDVSVLHRDFGNASSEFLIGDVTTGLDNYNASHPEDPVAVTPVEVAHSAAVASRDVSSTPRPVTPEMAAARARVLADHDGGVYGLATATGGLGAVPSVANLTYQGNVAPRPIARNNYRFTMHADEMANLQNEMGTPQARAQHNQLEQGAADVALLHLGMQSDPNISGNDVHNMYEVAAALYRANTAGQWVGYGINDPNHPELGVSNQFGYMVLEGRHTTQEQMNHDLDAMVTAGTITAEQRASYGSGYREYVRARLDVEVSAGRVSRENADRFFTTADELRVHTGVDLFDASARPGPLAESARHQGPTTINPPGSEPEVIEVDELPTVPPNQRPSPQRPNRVETRVAPRIPVQEVAEPLAQLAAGVADGENRSAMPDATSTRTPQPPVMSRTAPVSQASSTTTTSTSTSSADFLLDLPESAVVVSGRARSPGAVLGSDLSPGAVQVTASDGAAYRFDGAVQVGDETYVRFTLKRGEEKSSIYVRCVDPASVSSEERASYYRAGISSALAALDQRASARAPQTSEPVASIAPPSPSVRVVAQSILANSTNVDLATVEALERDVVHNIVSNEQAWARVRSLLMPHLTDDNRTVGIFLWRLVDEVRSGNLTMREVERVHPDYAASVGRLRNVPESSLGRELCAQADQIVAQRGGPLVIAMRDLVRDAVAHGVAPDVAAAQYAPALEFFISHRSDPMFRDIVFGYPNESSSLSYTARLIQISADLVSRAQQIQQAASNPHADPDLAVGAALAMRYAQARGHVQPTLADCLESSMISALISRDIEHAVGFSGPNRSRIDSIVESARYIVEHVPLERINSVYSEYYEAIRYSYRVWSQYESFDATTITSGSADLYYVCARLAVTNPESLSSLLVGSALGSTDSRFDLFSLFPRPQNNLEPINGVLSFFASSLRSSPPESHAALGNMFRMALEDASRLPEGLRSIYLDLCARNYSHSEELLGRVSELDAQARDSGVLVVGANRDLHPRRIRRLPILGELMLRSPQIGSQTSNPFRVFDVKLIRQAMPNDRAYADFAQLLINYARERSEYTDASNQGLIVEGVPASATPFTLSPELATMRVGHHPRIMAEQVGYRFDGYVRHDAQEYATFSDPASSRRFMVRLLAPARYTQTSLDSYYSGLLGIAHSDAINRVFDSVSGELGRLRGSGRVVDDARADFINRRFRMINSIYEFSRSGAISPLRLNEFIASVSAHPDQFIEAGVRLFRTLVPSANLTEEWLSSNVDLFLQYVTYRNTLSALANGGAERIGSHTSTSAQFTQAIAVLDRALSAHANGTFRDFKFPPEFRAELDRVCSHSSVDSGALWNMWTNNHDFSVSVSDGSSTRQYRVSETGDFDRSFRYGLVAGNEACQVPTNTHPVVGGIVGSVAQPWIRQIIIPIEGSPNTLYRQTLNLLIGDDGRPIIMVQPAYGLRDIPSEQRQQLEAQILANLRSRYEPLGVEVRSYDLDSPSLVPDTSVEPVILSGESRTMANGTVLPANRPLNQGYSTFTLRAPFAYMDSNRRAMPDGGTNGFHPGTMGERLFFPHRHGGSTSGD